MQGQILTWIEQAIEELEKANSSVPTPVQVTQWLTEVYNVDLPLEQVAGNMQIVIAKNSR